MLSNQKLQNSLNEIKEISHMDTALFTAKGKLVAHTEEMPLPEALEQQVVVDFAESLAEKQTYQDYHLYKVMVEGETEYFSLSGERRVISCMRTDGGLPDPESGYEFCRAVRPQ